ncbi:MAG: RES family NAD+ phosphorylase [Bryobacteraceae bacterium]
MGGSFFRNHPSDRGPLYYGKSRRYRFDDPLGEYRVLYTARDAYGAFIETFGQITGIRTVSSALLKSYCLSELYPPRPLIMVDLCGSGCLVRIGADSRLFAGERSVARKWSRAIYQHPDVKVDGILFPARHNHERQAAAIFDRGPELEVIETRPWYEPDGKLRSELPGILDFYGFGIVETEIRPAKKNPGRADALQGELFDP